MAHTFERFTSSPEAISRFIGLADVVISELERAIASNDVRYFNADIALRNVRNWRESALSGTLHASGATLGVSKSDLMFGPIEEQLYELEHIYAHYIQGRP